MKVHPEIFMKTKEREKLRLPNVSKDAGGHGVRSQRRAGRVMIATSRSLSEIELAIRRINNLAAEVRL